MENLNEFDNYGLNVMVNIEMKHIDRKIAHHYFDEKKRSSHIKEYLDIYQYFINDYPILKKLPFVELIKIMYKEVLKLNNIVFESKEFTSIFDDFAKIDDEIDYIYENFVSLKRTYRKEVITKTCDRTLEELNGLRKELQ